MAHLAIQGHATRGNEVIELLKMLGGIDSGFFSGNEIDRFYYIEVDKGICFIDSVVEHLDFHKMTLEQFLKRFPYKVGNRVKNVYGAYGKVYAMKWIDDEIQYRLDFGHHTSGWYGADELQPFEEKESMKTITIDDFKAGTKEWLIDKLYDMLIVNAVKAIGDLHEELHKPQYPKTYDECCEVLGIGSYFEPEIRNATTEECHKFTKLIRLKRCRDAYWKIAGDEMGLGKPWEPQEGVIYCYMPNAPHCIRLMFPFPTEEMRDAFYENFKKEIEICKELL